MSKCKACGKEMSFSYLENAADTCEWNTSVTYPDGVTLPSLSYHFEEPGGRCGDCNIKHGGKHHPGCDVERCPRCEGQLISCGCLDQFVRGSRRGGDLDASMGSNSKRI